MGGAAQLLTVVAGNSTLDCVRHDTGARVRFPAGADFADFADFVRAAAPVRCAAVSVVAPLRTGLAGALAELGVPVRFAGAELPCPLPLDYRTPATLGADRWVGALAAHREFGRCVVVDCGTATTVNLVEQDGTFRGGAIAPGLRAFVLGMAAATPALPAPDLDAAPELPPRSTQAAVDTGVLLGWCGLVERLVAELRGAAAGPARLVITGGNAPRLCAHAARDAMHIPDLVHRGLCLLDALACGS